jgi:dTDP-glucose 4,6-dehydratase
LGFIGSAVVRHLVTNTDHEVLNLDKHTYAATDGSVAAVADSEWYRHEKVDIADGAAVADTMARFRPDAIVHLAAESHVDRSIDDPGEFIRTNVVGTYELLQAARDHAENRGILDRFRFVHVSTDEVFGSLGADDKPFDPSTPYDPRSPYSASKAAADHLARAWFETYGLPTIVTNCSNNYGPFHFPEKLIPLMIIKALAGEPLPVYGDGSNVRDWLYVDDHASALVTVLESGTPGRTYTIGGNAERSNLEVVNAVCDLVDSAVGDEVGGRRSLIEFVADRPGHDWRYAIDASAITHQLGWRPSVTFEQGLARTVDWYLANDWWWRPLTELRYQGQRLGTARVG